MLNLATDVKIKSKVDHNYFIEMLIFVIAALNFHPTELSLIIGGTIVSTALGLKFWLYSYPKRKNKKFEIYGPYRFVRFPHYLSTFVMSFGVLILGRSSLGMLVLFVTFIVFYSLKAKSLDRDREEQTGFEYAYYKGHVSGLIPSIIPYPGKTTKKPGFRHFFDTRSKPEVGIITISLLMLVYSYSFLNWPPLQGSHQVITTIFCLLATYLSLSKLKLKRSFYENSSL